MSERFFPDVERGKTGEMAALWFFSQNPSVKSIISCQGDSYYQDMDIDFLVQIGNKVVSVEVKTDYKAHETGNIFYELSTNGHRGCFEKTRADAILIYLPAVNKMYQFNTTALRMWVDRNKALMKTVSGGDASVGYAIPIKDLTDQRIAKEVVL